MHLVMGIFLTTLGTGVGGFIYARKKVNTQVPPQRSGALIWLDKLEKKNIQKQIYCRILPVPEHLTVARGAAVQRSGKAWPCICSSGRHTCSLP